jgi:hypothetical protein
MDLAAGVYLSEAPSPPTFLFGVVKQFCRLGIWSHTQCITPEYALYIAYSPAPLLHTVYSIMYKVEGPLFTVENTNMTDYLSSL